MSVYWGKTMVGWLLRFDEQPLAQVHAYDDRWFVEMLIEPYPLGSPVSYRTVEFAKADALNMAREHMTLVVDKLELDLRDARERRSRFSAAAEPLQEGGDGNG